MKRAALYLLLLFFSIFSLFKFFSPEMVYAMDSCESDRKISKIVFPSEVISGTSVSITVGNLSANTNYTMYVEYRAGMSENQTQNSGGSGEATFSFSGASVNSPGNKNVFLTISSNGLSKRCELGSFTVVSSKVTECDLSAKYTPVYSPVCIDGNSTVTVDVKNAVLNSNFVSGNKWLTDEAGKVITTINLDSNGNGKTTLGTLSPGDTLGELRLLNAPHGSIICRLRIDLNVLDSCKDQPGGSGVNRFEATCSGGGKYVDKDGNETGVDTALGCLPTNPETFVGAIIPWAIGLGGGIAFMLMLYGVLMIIVSAGNPEKMQAGREMITSAISGLVIIIFAVFLLRFIGVDILGLFPK